MDCAYCSDEATGTDEDGEPTCGNILTCTAVECVTCLGVGRIYNHETDEFRKCLDCNGAGK